MKIEEQTEGLESEEDHPNLDLSVDIYYPYLSENQLLEVTPTIAYGEVKRKLPMLQVQGHLRHKTVMTVLAKMGVRKIKKIYASFQSVRNITDANSNYSYMHQIPYEARKLRSGLILASKQNNHVSRKKA